MIFIAMPDGQSLEPKGVCYSNFYYTAELNTSNSQSELLLFDQNKIRFQRTLIILLKTCEISQIFYKAYFSTSNYGLMKPKIRRCLPLTIDPFGI